METQTERNEVRSGSKSVQPTVAESGLYKLIFLDLTDDIHIRI